MATPESLGKKHEEINKRRREFLKQASAAVGVGLVAPRMLVGGYFAADKMDGEHGPEEIKDQNATIALEVNLLREMRDVDIEQINKGIEPAIANFYTSKANRDNALAVLTASAIFTVGAFAAAKQQLDREIRRGGLTIPDDQREDKRKAAMTMSKGAAVGALVAGGILLSQPKGENYKAAENNFLSWVHQLRDERSGKREIITKKDIADRIEQLTDLQKKNSDKLRFNSN